LALFAVGIARAEDSKSNSGQRKSHDKATIAKVDSNKSTLTVTIKSRDGKETEKTFPLAEGAEYFDNQGKAAKIDAFHPGDHVLITEKDGKITELKIRKERTHATISKTDTKKGTVSVTMKDKGGKDVEKTFQFAQGAEYFDKHGKATKIDAFKSGDHVVITEKDGKISEMKECKEHAQAKITKVDAKNGKVTVMTKDANAKDVEETFILTEECEYVDSDGNVAVIDVFQSGDKVLIIESDGQIQELNKDKDAKVKKTEDKKVGAK
jgi:hypothetical protein